MGRYKSLAKNSSFVFIGNVGSKMIGFLMLPFYTSWMSVEEYGTADMVLVYMSLLLPFVSFSLTDAIFVFPANCEKEKQSAYFTSGLVAVLISFCLMALLFGGIQIFHLLDNSIFGDYIWYIYLLLITGFIQSYLQQFCMALDKMFIFSMSGIILTACTALLGFILIPQNGIHGYLCSLVLANVITILFTFCVVRLFCYINVKRYRVALVKEMIGYTIPLIPNALMWWLIASFNRITMEHYVGVYFIGLYAVASKIPSILTSLFNPLTNAWKLSVVQEYNKPTFVDYYNKIGRMLIMIISLGAVVFGLFSEMIITLFTDVKFHQSWIYSPVLILSLVFVGIGAAVDPIFLAVKRSKYFLWSSIIGASVGVVLNFILIPVVGIWGAVVSVVGAQFSIALSRLYFSELYIKLIGKFIILIYVSFAVLVNVAMSACQNYYLSALLTLMMAIMFYWLNRKYFSMVYLKIKRKYDKRENSRVYR